MHFKTLNPFLTPTTLGICFQTVITKQQIVILRHIQINALQCILFTSENSCCSWQHGKVLNYITNVIFSHQSTLFVMIQVTVIMVNPNYSQENFPLLSDYKINILPHLISNITKLLKHMYMCLILLQSTIWNTTNISY